MCEHFGYEVTKLERIRIMGIGLKGLPLGDWRDLNEIEMKSIYKLIASSSSEIKTKPNKPSLSKNNVLEKRNSNDINKKELHGKSERSNKGKPHHSKHKNTSTYSKRRGKR
jgi:23S rRNA pseudouridine2604 synthase